MVALARLPWPRTLTPLFMPMRRRIGPLTTTHRPDRHRRGQQAVHVELVGAGGLDRGEHDGQVLGPAPGQHGVDRDLLDRALDEVGRHDGDDLVGRPGRALEHAQHPGLGGRHDGQAVGPAAVEHRLDLVLELAELDPAAAQRRCPRSARASSSATSGSRVSEPQPGRCSGRSAPRPATPVSASHCGAVPADGAVDLGAASRPDERRHRLDVEREASARARCRRRRRDALGERRVVLGEHRQRVDRGELARAPARRAAGRAVPLHHGDESVGE